MGESNLWKIFSAVLARRLLKCRTQPNMSDPNTPSITEAGSPVPQSINLNEIGQRYLAALQRTFDIAACLVAGSGAATEERYDELAKAVRFRPSAQLQRNFENASRDTRAYLVKSVIGDALAIVIPFMEDVRSFCTAATWNNAGTRDPEVLRKLLSTDRDAFLRMSLTSMMETLKRDFEVFSPLAGSVFALMKAGICIGSRGGVVSEDDVTFNGVLAFSLVTLDVSAGEESPRVAEVRHSFAVGDTVRLKDEDYLHIVSTIAMFCTSMLHSVRDAFQPKMSAAA